MDRGGSVCEVPFFNDSDSRAINSSRPSWLSLVNSGKYRSIWVCSNVLMAFCI